MPSDVEARLAIYTLWLAIFTAVLAVSTILLWIETRRAGTRQANDTRTLERAFVFAKEVSVFIERSPGQMGGYGHEIPGQPSSYRFWVILENSGRSPATRAVYNFNCGHVTGENIATFAFPDQQRPRSGVIGPQATLHTNHQTVSPAAIEQIIRGIDRWFLWGWIDYNDIFADTQRHRTEFCFEISAHRTPDHQTLFGFPMHDRFNATDGDCLRPPAAYTRA